MTDLTANTLTEEAKYRGIYVAMRWMPNEERMVTRQRIEYIIDSNWRNDRHALNILIHASRLKMFEEYATKLEQHQPNNIGETDTFLATCYLELGVKPEIRQADKPEPKYWKKYTVFCEAVCRSVKYTCNNETN